jgi:hypothetical protein
MAWTMRPVRRSITFFGRKLFHIERPLLVCTTHFSQLTTDPDALALPLDAHPEAAGVYVQAQPVSADLPRFALRGGLVRYVPTHYDRYMVKLPATFADYLQKFSNKHRKALARRVRKHEEENGGFPAFRLYQSPAEMLEFLALAMTFAGQTFQARLFQAQLRDTPEFRRQMLALAERGDTLGALLFDKERPIAFWWFTRDGEVLVSEYTGYDDAYRPLGPGTLVLWRVLEHAHADGRTRVLDFGEGHADYKEYFANDRQRCAEVYYLRRASLPNLGLMSFDSASWGARRALGPIERELERRGLKSKLKKFLRRTPATPDKPPEETQPS